MQKAASWWLVFLIIFQNVSCTFDSSTSSRGKRSLLFFGGGQANKTTRPNIIYILLDDLDERVTLPFLPEVMPFAMNLMKKGTYFQNNFSASICCESRAGILTGLLPHNNGVFTNGGPFGGRTAFRAPKNSDGTPMLNAQGKQVDNETRTIAKLLSDSGYRTGIIGKYLNGFDITEGKLPAIPIGWSEGAVFGNSFSYIGYKYKTVDWTNPSSPQEKSFGILPKDYSTDVLSNRTIEFLNRTKMGNSGQPFFLYLTPTAPHLPLPPAPRHLLKASRWTGTLPTGRPNYFSDGPSFDDKPFWLQASLSHRDNPRLRLWTDVDWQLRLGSLYAVDEMIERVWNWLKSNGYAENTVILLTSDNGYNLGAHSLIHKQAPYEESVRVPLWILGGSTLGFKEATNVSSLTQHIDHAPTILELAGVAGGNLMDGMSLVPHLKGGAIPAWRNDLFHEFIGSKPPEELGGIAEELPPATVELLTYYAAPGFFLDVPTYRSLRTRYEVNGTQKEFSFVHWRDNLTVPEEFEIYDVVADPYQVTNLLHYNPAGCLQLKALLKKRLDFLAACKGEGCRKPILNSTEFASATKTCK